MPSTCQLCGFYKPTRHPKGGFLARGECYAGPPVVAVESGDGWSEIHRDVRPQVKKRDIACLSFREVE